MVTILHDNEDRLQRYNRLKDYLSAALYEEDRRFTCAHHETCAASCKDGKTLQTGEAPGVGDYYSLMVDGKPLRIVVVGISIGWVDFATDGKILHSLEERTSKVHNADFRPDNPHMRGTILALQTLFGQEAYVNQDGHHSDELFGLQLESGLVNLSMCYAMANRVACSVGYPGSNRSDKTTDLMHENCEEHFLNYLDILEPTVIIVQGDISMPEKYAANNEATKPPFILQFPHPSARGLKKWSSHNDKEYQKTVAPELLKIAQYYGFAS